MKSEYGQKEAMPGRQNEILKILKKGDEKMPTELTLPMKKDIERYKVITIYCTEEDEPVVNQIIDQFIHKNWIKVRRKWRKANLKKEVTKVQIKQNYFVV